MLTTLFDALLRHPFYLEPAMLLSVMLLVDRWDEWVDRSRLLKYSEANLNLQKSLQQANAAATAAQMAASSGAGSSAKGAGYVDPSYILPYILTVFAPFCSMSYPVIPLSSGRRMLAVHLQDGRTAGGSSGVGTT